MSKLKPFLKRLLPNGVEYKQLGKIATYATERIDAQTVNTDTYVGVENLLPDKRGKTASNYVPINGKLIQFLEGDILIGNIRPYLKKIWRATHSGGTNGDVLTVRLNNQNEICSKFLYYVLSSDSFFLYAMQNAKGAKMPRGDKAAVLRYFIPVPPLEVQQEIVRILDQFTQFTAELTAELTAREMQYKYYREKLLSLGEEIPVKQLGDICNVTAGGTPSKKNREYWDKGTIKWLSSTVCKNKKTVDEITDYVTPKGIAESSAKIMSAGTTLVALVGATIGKVAFLPFEAAINQNVAGIFPKNPEELLPSYVYYSCTALYPKFLVLTQGTKLAMANMAFVRALKIPVPSLPEQRRIVSILDRFDALCNDLTSGLPAEIAARQKQYEYYRDKLLSFKEL